MIQTYCLPNNVIFDLQNLEHTTRKSHTIGHDVYQTFCKPLFLSSGSFQCIVASLVGNLWSAF